MTLAEISDRLKATSALATETDQRLARLAMLALAAIAREHWPAAAYILLHVTDQNDSGELWVQAVYDVNHETIADSEKFDNDPVAYHMHEGNEVQWLPYVKKVDDEEYVLDIAKVLAEITLD